MMDINLVPRAFPSKNGPTHFLRKSPGDEVGWIYLNLRNMEGGVWGEGGAFGAFCVLRVLELLFFSMVS